MYASVCFSHVQADLSGTKFPNARSTFQFLVKENGIRSLYKGGGPRMCRNIGAFFLIGLMREKFIDYRTAQMGL
jgi:hypothetical protein